MINFYIISGITVLFALYMVIAHNTFRSILAFLGVILGIGALYFLLQNYILAAIQILIYGGAVIVITLFIFMLTPEIEKTSPKIGAAKKILAAVSSAIFLGILIYTFRELKIAEEIKSFGLPEIGKRIMENYSFQLEVLSVLLLSTLIGAIVIARNNENTKS